MKTAKLIIILLIFLFPVFSHYAYADEGCIKAEIKKELIEASPWEGGDVEVDEIQLTGYNGDDFDKVEIKVPEGMKNIGKVSVQALLHAKGKDVKTLWATARIRVFKEVVVSLNPLKANRKITRGDIKLLRTEVRDTQDSFSSVDEVEGMLVKRPVPAGAILKKDYIKHEVVIKRGERVVLNLDAKKFRVRSSGIAKQDGSKGGVIGVKTASGREVVGKVSGPGEIIVEF